MLVMYAADADEQPRPDDPVQRHQHEQQRHGRCDRVQRREPADCEAAHEQHAACARAVGQRARDRAPRTRRSTSAARGTGPRPPCCRRDRWMWNGAVGRSCSADRKTVKLNPHITKKRGVNRRSVGASVICRAMSITVRRCSARTFAAPRGQQQSPPQRARATGRSRGRPLPSPSGNTARMPNRQTDSQCAARLDSIGVRVSPRPRSTPVATPCRPSNSWKNAATNSRVMPSADDRGVAGEERR